MSPDLPLAKHTSYIPASIPSNNALTTGPRRAGFLAETMLVATSANADNLERVNFIFDFFLEEGGRLVLFMWWRWKSIRMKKGDYYFSNCACSSLCHHRPLTKELVLSLKASHDVLDLLCHWHCVPVLMYREVTVKCMYGVCRLYL